MSKKRINCIAASLAFLMLMIYLEPLYTSILGFIFIQLCMPVSVIFITEAIKEKFWKKENTKIWCEYISDIFELAYKTLAISFLIAISTSLLLELFIKNYFNYGSKMSSIIYDVSVWSNLIIISFFSFRSILKKSVRIYREKLLYNYKDLYDFTLN